MDAAQWDERYRASAGGVWATQPPAVVREIVTPLPSGTAIDVATGDGRTALWLAERGWACTGLDFSSAGLALAAARPGGDAVEWVQADVHEWEPDAPVDLVVSCYLHLPDSAAATARIAQWVTPGGTLVVVGHDVENIAAGGHGPPTPRSSTPRRCCAARSTTGSASRGANGSCERAPMRNSARATPRRRSTRSCTRCACADARGPRR